MILSLTVGTRNCSMSCLFLLTHSFCSSSYSPLSQAMGLNKMLKTATQVSIFLSLPFCFASTFLHIVLSCSSFICQARFKYTRPHFTWNCYFITNTFFNLLCFFRCQSWRMGYIPALQEPGTFIWRLHTMCRLHLSCIMCFTWLPSLSPLWQIFTDFLEIHREIEKETECSSGDNKVKRMSLIKPSDALNWALHTAFIISFFRHTL